MIDVNRLMKKRGWTGEEAGKALILNLTDNYQHILNGEKDAPPLFSSAQLKRMIESFRGSNSDIEAYNRYINLQNWIMQYQAVANANLQRFQSCFHELMSVHNAAESAENEYRYIEQLPRIMTAKQYEELKARRIEETLDPDGDGTDAIADNIPALILRLAQYYARELEAHPKQANPLKAIKKLYTGKPVKDKGTIAAYNKEAGIGYHTLPDGTRSDEVTPEEWKAKLLHYSPDLQRIQAEAEEGYSGAPGSLAYERMTKKARAAHMGEPAPEEGRSAAVWHISEEAPEGLNKWDIIAFDAEEETFFGDLYPAAFAGEGEEAEALEQAEAFRKEYPELVEAILKALDALGFTSGTGKKAKPLSALPLQEWYTTVFSWRDLYNRDFPGFRAWVESDLNVFGQDKRALMNGIAILRPSDVLRNPIGGRLSAAIDGNGYFKEPEGEKLFSNMFSLDAYTPANPESGENILRIEESRETLEQSLAFILGYDEALELIAKEIDIPDFTIFKANAGRSLERAEALNGLFDLLYTHIEEIDYRDAERKAAKLQALRDVFYPLRTEELKPSEKQKRKAAEMLEGLEAFGDSKTGTSPGWNFLATLTGLEGGAEE